MNHKEHEGSRKSLLPSSVRDAGKLVALWLLRTYKWAVSPMFPPACRYVPTCSEYAMEAVERYGVVRGGLKALARLMRCHPFAHGGYDPVVQHECASPHFSQSTREMGHLTTTNNQRAATNHGAI